MGSIFPDSPSAATYVSHIWKITRPGSRFDWATPGKDPLDRTIVNRAGVVDGLSCQIVESTQTTGGQLHFYMEPQACIVEPADSRRIDRASFHPEPHGNASDHRHGSGHRIPPH